jgi:hypothetical protein
VFPLFHISFGDVVTRFRQRASQAAFLTLAASYMDAVWVEGIIELAETETDMGDSGHRLKARTVVPFEEPD